MASQQNKCGEIHLTGKFACWNFSSEFKFESNKLMYIDYRMVTHRNAEKMPKK